MEQVESTPKKLKLEKNQLGLVASLILANIVIGMDKSLISTAILPISTELNLDTGQSGLLMSLFFLGYSLMQIPSGWLADKKGSKIVLIASLGIVSIFSFLFGISQSFTLLILIRFIVGVGNSGFPPSSVKAVADNFEKNQRTVVQSIVMATGGLGAILAYTMGAYLISTNWRYGYFVESALVLVSLVMLLRFAPNHQVKELSEIDRNKLSFLTILKDKSVYILFTAMLLLNFVLFGIQLWMPTYLNKEFGLTIGKISLILSLISIMQIVVTVLAGLFLSKFFQKKEKLFISTTMSLTFVLILAFMMSKNLTVSIILLFCIVFFAISAFTAMFAWPHQIFSKEVMGSKMGIINTGGTLGGFLAPVVMGYLIKIGNGSFGNAFIAMSVSALCCGITVLFYQDKNK